MKVKGSKKMKDLEPDNSKAKGGKGPKGGSLPPPTIDGADNLNKSGFSFGLLSVGSQIAHNFL